MSECTHDCSTCSENCSDREITYDKPHELSSIKKVIGVVSGKGGVGKSLVTSLLAVLASRKGLKTAILDADITGPSIPRAFGIENGANSDGTNLYPSKSKGGISVMSSNLLLEHENDPVIWRGPMIAGMVKQFWTDVIWNDVDVMFIDMPPGTGDVPLTVFQSIKVDGIVIVTSPQELVSMIVEKAVKMADMMNVKIYGIVENMSYVKCPDCGKEIKLFGNSPVNTVCHDNNLKLLGKLPFDSELSDMVDAGEIEDVENAYLDDALNEILK